MLAPAALMTARRGTFLTRPSSFNSANALPKAEQFPRLPPGTMTQSGGSQSRASRMRYMMRLLALEAEGVDAVHQVDAQLRHVDGDLPDAAEAGVEVALDLERQRAVVERLRELAEADLARCR